MKKIHAAVLLLSLVALAGHGRAAEPANQVLSYHGDATREGDFVMPRLSWARARSLHPDNGFHAEIAGDVNAQPLVWRRGGSGPSMILVATENDTLYALNAQTGAKIWEKTVGSPVPRADLPCGNISPLGITGTPVIDASRQGIYFEAMILGASGAPEHAVFGLSLHDGSTLPGWPVDVASALKAQGLSFNTAAQNDRGALTVLGDTVYVPFGGHFGDCGAYHGWVIGVSLDAPHKVMSWHTQANGGAVWSPAGISSDGSNLFVATGNSMADMPGERKFTAPPQWGGGEAVIKLPPDLSFAANPADYFTPADWAAMDSHDQDLGGIAPMLFDLGSRPMALALGKDGKAYLLDRNHPGGMGGALVSEQVTASPIRGAGAVVSAGDSELAAFQGPGAHCPNGEGAGLTMLKISGAPTTISTAWCAAVDGRGSPIVTTTDGHSNPVVWILGAEGDNRLYGFRADTGERLFESGVLPGLQHFQTLIATSDRLYVAAANGLYAFTF